ncbi:GlxA family transcriptional regulator [Ruegeria atlantica]|uniref:GlxA family transcriptional regulator n=1 Tax=Ruegeria atlantica TaxID=81569 RepID=UPI0020C43573|nr:GlxA family transcriptional regulator [Ruegeria atlantica]
MHQISALMKDFEGRGRISIGILLLPNFPMACLSSVIEPLRAANEIERKDVFFWSVFSEDGASVCSSAKIPIQVNGSLSDAQGIDFMFVLSEPDGRFCHSGAAAGRLRYMSRHGTKLCAVSGGVFPLARSGILDGQTCSVHWCYRTAFEAEFPQIEIVDNVIVMSRRCCTASGAAGAFDLSLHIIEDNLGEAVMTEVACWFQHSAIRSPGIRQKTPAFKTDETADHLPSKVSHAVSLFSENLEYPLTTREVARRVGVSARHLERSFKQATGQSPGEYYRLLRLRAARQLVIYTQDSFTSIAHAVGYANQTSMSRNYLIQFGTSPRQDRQECNRFRVRQNSPVH